MTEEFFVDISIDFVGQCRIFQSISFLKKENFEEKKRTKNYAGERKKTQRMEGEYEKSNEIPVE